jgi:hypothetical protein
MRRVSSYVCVSIVVAGLGSAAVWWVLRSPDPEPPVPENVSELDPMLSAT